MAGNHNHMSWTVAGYDPVSGNDNIRLLVESSTVTTDSATGITYAQLKTSSTSTDVTSSGAIITSVAAATSDTALLASNTSRKGAYFFNDSTATLYLAFATSVSTSSYTVQIPANGFFEAPTSPVYTGAFHGIWSAANGNVRITELS